VNSPVPLYLALVAYVVAGAGAAFRRRWTSVAASAAGITLQLVFTVSRAAAIGFLPFASRFEAMAIFALAVQTTGFVLYLSTRQHSAKLGTDIAGVIILVGALMPVGFHTGGDLNPILNSPWFAFHILVAFAGYGCFTAGLAWSVAHVFDRRLDLNSAVPRRLALAGLLLLGTGIVSGAAWADSSWGTYWSWDPKESWALLTWTLMLGFVHVRPRSRAGAVAWYGIVFAAMMFTFVGINLLKWGMHRY
jgi:ABC-type transport system involved in cytochrome c biogenesis permease subunit